jgi:ATP-dependent 26S proteasome regulatory subunit
MNEKDLRDCFALFIACGMIMKYNDVDPEIIWKMADDMMEARNKEVDEELGIAAVKTKRQYVRKTYHK